METTVLERFLRYIAVDTMSEPEKEQIPSTEKQRVLGAMLAQELKDMGASDVRMDDHAYVYAAIPATTDKKIPVLGLIAHMDTACACSGKDVKPRFVKNYDGGNIVMDPKTGLSMGPDQYPELKNYVGQDLITTDGSTLLGADDKAGVAEIMAMASYLLQHPEIAHGKVRIGFTPDEEVGAGADHFNVELFGADYAYTVDGGPLGEMEFENFNAAGAKVYVHGRSVHPGSAKDKMRNAILMAQEFQSMLPVAENPMYTCGYEGFYHLDTLHGNVEEAVAEYIIRDHDRVKFEKKKELFLRIAGYLNEKYGAGTFEIDMKDSYYNMREVIEKNMFIIEQAKEAMAQLDVEPSVSPIRGGTDGARLSFMGLPCPNLCTGGRNAHGKYEYACIDDMETIVKLLVKIVER